MPKRKHSGEHPATVVKTPEKGFSELLQKVNFREWTVEDTSTYLQNEGLGQSAETFKENEITGVMLQHLTQTKLEEMDIKPSEWLKILDIINELQQMTSLKVFNDPIHGHLKMHPLLVKFIDTPQFQRLRNIKQLGGKYFVFPGASHNRFEHSIGVAHLAGVLVETLKEKQPELNISPRDVLCVQIAGLCHDLGHGPFSHLFDGMFIPKVRLGHKWKHEEASLEMFDHMVKKNELEKEMEKYGLVLEEDLVFIKELIDGPALGKKWSCKGRKENKSFLYEIVANKRNGIDVDKWDYFARDCHHLGIQNNFDHGRYITFARVCHSKCLGKNIICVRDKEWSNVHGMFHTRSSLHRRAYQHQVGRCIEMMITEAFVKADKHIKFQGSGGKMFQMSEAIDDMEAYTKLTDSVFEQILNSSSNDLKEAREILENIICRRLYKCLGETQAETKADEWRPKTLASAIASSKPELCTGLKNVTLNAEDLEVDIVTIPYGMKAENPMENVMFYFKADPTTTAYNIDKATELVTSCHQEKLIRVYCKKSDEGITERAKKHFDKWCEDEELPLPRDAVITSPEIVKNREVETVPEQLQNAKKSSADLFGED